MLYVLGTGVVCQKPDYICLKRFRESYWKFYYSIKPHFGCTQNQHNNHQSKTKTSTIASGTCYVIISYSQVSHGVAELAETVGNTAANASEQLAAVAQKVDQLEEKKFPRRRNGLD